MPKNITAAEVKNVKARAVFMMLFVMEGLRSATERETSFAVATEIPAVAKVSMIE